MTTNVRPSNDGGWSAAFPSHWGPVELARQAEGLRIPKVRCKGLCQDQCTTIPVTPAERARVESAIGGVLGTDEHDRCSALGADGLCRAYLVRPTVCRLYGAAEALMCPHGCETVDGVYLEYLEGIGFMMADAVRDGDHEPTGPLC